MKRKIPKYTRAGKNGTIIECPECAHQMIMYHFSWYAIVCTGCKTEIEKTDCLLPKLSPSQEVEVRAPHKLEMTLHELGYAAGNAIKNILHFRSLKGGIEELQAAKEYIDLLINSEHAYGKVALCKHCKKQMNNLHKHPKQFCSASCRGKEYRRAGHRKK